MTTTHLNGHHRRTLDSIFRHPTSHNVEWHDVLSLLNNIGTAQEHHSGKVEVTVGADHVTLAKVHGKDVAADELRQLRSFLGKVGIDPASVTAEAVSETDTKHVAQSWIVLVDHRCAKLFAISDSPCSAAAPLLVAPDDPYGYLRHLEHRREGDHDGGRVPEDDGYYEAIAGDLASAAQIVILNDGKGRSSAGKYLLAYLKSHHAGIASCVVAMERVDISHLSDGEIIEIGRSHLAGHPVG